MPPHYVHVPVVPVAALFHLLHFAVKLTLLMELDFTIHLHLQQTFLTSKVASQIRIPVDFVFIHAIQDTK